MILTTHALVGAVIGAKFNSPWIIIPASLVVHFAMDHLRHGEYLNQKSTLQDTIGKVAMDISIGLTLIAGVIFFRYPDIHRIYSICLGVFFSMLPDLFTFLYWKIFKNKLLEKLYRLHARIHRFPPFSPEREWNLRNFRNDLAISLVALITLIIIL